VAAVDADRRRDGHEDRVIDLDRRCRERLADLPTEPAASPRRLLDQPRR
jgi:hypothetical protein